MTINQQLLTVLTVLTGMDKPSFSMNGSSRFYRARKGCVAVKVQLYTSEFDAEQRVSVHVDTGTGPVKQDVPTFVKYSKAMFL